ncbi:MAG TPA: hypothetical protein VGM38_00640 [Pseudolysinimonas sp.]|jgi:hypothetical protein
MATQRLSFLVLLITMAAVASGCSASPVQPSQEAPPPTLSPSASPLSAPRPALPDSCSQLLPLDQLQSELVDPVSVKVDETHLPRYLEQLAVLQAGGTECAWGGKNATDSTWDTGVELEILPNASSDFATWESNSQAPRAVVSSLGDASGLTCFPDSGWCRGDTLVGGYWVSFSVNDVNTRDAAVATTKANTVMSIVVAAIRSAGPAQSNWTTPDAMVTGNELCTAGSSSTVGSIVATSEPMTMKSNAIGYGITTVAASRTRMTSCDWSNNSGDLGIATLPAGSWAFPELEAIPPIWVMIGVPSAGHITGTDGMLSACGDGCRAFVSLGGSLVSVSQDSDTETTLRFATTVQKTADAIRAADN